MHTWHIDDIWSPQSDEELWASAKRELGAAGAETLTRCESVVGQLVLTNTTGPPLPHLGGLAGSTQDPNPEPTP